MLLKTWLTRAENLNTYKRTSTGEDAPGRARQLWWAMYKDGRWARAWDDAAAFGDAPLGRRFVEKADAAATLAGGLTLQRALTAPDGTHK